MDIEQIFESFNMTKIVVIGDVMIDAYLWGKVDRISPEAPVPILTYKNEENRLGGAANVALNLQALGSRPILCSVVGMDSYSDAFNELLITNNMDTDGILTEQSRTTTVKTRIISGTQQLLRVDKENTVQLDEIVEERFIKNTINIIKSRGVNGIIFEDYDKGCITPNVIAQITEYANLNDIPIFVDPKRNNFKHYRNVTLFKPNFKEFCEGVDIRIAKTDYKGLNWAARFLHSSQKIEYLMVTLSEEGIFLSGDNKYTTLPIKAREIVDVSGAGDTVISTSALCFVSGLSMNQSAMIGNCAAGQVCTKVGVVPVNKGQLLAELKEQNIQPELRS